MGTDFEGSQGLVTYKGKLLFLKRDKFDKKASGLWCLLGGGPNQGETPEETLKRELKEEANIRTSNYKLVFKRPSMNNPKLFTYIFLVNLNDEELENIKIGDEGEKLQFFYLDEIKDLTLVSSLEKYFDIYRKYIIS